MGKTTTPHRISSHGIAALAGAAALLFCALVYAPGAWAANTYGQLCAQFESDTNPYAYDASDPYGGNVFGAFQMSAGHAVAYAQGLQENSNATYAKYGDQLMAAYKKDGSKCTKNFAKAWKSIFPNDSANYLGTQYTYVKKAYYKPAAAAWESAIKGFKASSYSTALKNVIFSTAVQHGVTGSTSVFTRAMSAIGGYKTTLAEDRIICAVYAERARAESYATLKSRVQASNSSAVVYKITAADGGTYATQYGLVNKTLTHFYSNPGAVQAAVYNRLAVEEPQLAFNMYKKYTGKTPTNTVATVKTMSLSAGASTCSHTHTKGGTVTKYYKLTDKTHKEKVSAKVCTDCNTTLKEAFTRTVENKFKQKGKSYKDVSGRSYTVHSKGYYKLKYDLNLRSKASASSTLKATLSKGKVVKVKKAVMGSDNFWWGKVKVSGKTGYVQLQYLSKLGTASSKHKYVSGKCKYCGKSKTQLKRIAKIVKAVGNNGSKSCKFAKKGKAYKNAYKKTSAVKKSYKKGAKVKIVKVVKNRYNDYWGKTSDGTYVDLSYLKT